ncbi:hypothetical protein WA158_003516 [Blastocystis sp. Blastoise]
MAARVAQTLCGVCIPPSAVRRKEELLKARSETDNYNMVDQMKEQCNNTVNIIGLRKYFLSSIEKYSIKFPDNKVFDTAFLKFKDILKKQVEEGYSRRSIEDTYYILFHVEYLITENTFHQYKDDFVSNKVTLIIWRKYMSKNRIANKRYIFSVVSKELFHLDSNTLCIQNYCYIQNINRIINLWEITYGFHFDKDIREYSLNKLLTNNKPISDNTGSNDVNKESIHDTLNSMVDIDEDEMHIENNGNIITSFNTDGTKSLSTQTAKVDEGIQLSYTYNSNSSIIDIQNDRNKSHHENEIDKRKNNTSIESEPSSYICGEIEGAIDSTVDKLQEYSLTKSNTDDGKSNHSDQVIIHKKRNIETESAATSYTNISNTTSISQSKEEHNTRKKSIPICKYCNGYHTSNNCKQRYL